MTSFYESYIGTSEEEREVMLSELGLSNVKELFSDIPSELLLNGPLSIPGPYSEIELDRLFKKISNKNNSTAVSFTGGGLREQYIPAALEELMRRGELYTAYTPYQPEVSQGMLQIIFEYQSMVAELIGMDIVNASMYDWASAVGEALRIMHRTSKKTKILMVEPIAPNRTAVANSYIKHTDIELVHIPEKQGNIDSDAVLEILNSELQKEKKERTIGGIYLETPNYYGTLGENIETIADVMHEIKGYVTIGTDPIACAIFKTPGDLGADFVVGEGQVLGNSISSGGPLLGILASKFDRKVIRNIPGRLIGVTDEKNGNGIGYCITLQTREQHIRREKATSNICSNQAITAVNGAIYLASLGKQGVVELAETLLNRAHYLANQLAGINNVNPSRHKQFFFSEFLVEFEGIDHEKLEKHCVEHGFVPGIRIKGDGCIRLISVSELQTKKDMDEFISCITEVMN